nr:uncharacterized protein LOC106687741 [Halyomorpha halys]
MRLENTEKIRMENRGSRHSLIIRDVEEKDFTNYSCEADNSQGKTKEHVILSGLPLPVVFKSPSTSQTRDSFNISWSVNSFSPIEMYRLYYRKFVPGGELDPSPPTRKAPKKYNQWSTSLAHKEWTEVIVPGDGKEKPQIHEGHFLIRKLEPKTEYEARAQAKNRFGWSSITDAFKFKTKGMDGITLDLTPEPAYNSQESPRHLEATAGCTQIYFLYRTWVYPMLFFILAII